MQRLTLQVATLGQSPSTQGHADEQLLSALKSSQGHIKSLDDKLEEQRCHMERMQKEHAAAQRLVQMEMEGLRALLGPRLSHGTLLPISNNPETSMPAFTSSPPLTSATRHATQREKEAEREEVKAGVVSEVRHAVREVMKEFSLQHPEISPRASSASTTSRDDGRGHLHDGLEGFQPPPHMLKLAVSHPENVQDPILASLARSRKPSHEERGIVESEALAALLSANTGFQPPPPDSRAGSCDAQIQMIGGSQASQVGIASGFVHPLLQGVQPQRPLLQNKHHGGWKTFEQRWRQRMDYILACNRGMTPPDNLLLEDLRQSLDVADQSLLERRREQNGRLTFQEFYEELQGLYDRDSAAQQRLAWESCKLPQGELNLDRWLEFQREFQLKRDRVEDKTPQEEYRNLMRNLPVHWQRLVVQEEAKRKKGKYLVRVTNVPQRPSYILQENIRVATGELVDKVQETINGYMVFCPDAQTQKKVLGLNGWTLGGRVVKATRMECTLTGDEICDFIADRLQTEARLQGIQQSLQTQSNPAREVAVVQEEQKGGRPQSPRQEQTPSPRQKGGQPAGKGKGQPGGKGRNNSPSSSGLQHGRGKGGDQGKGGKGGPVLCGYCQSLGRNSRHTEWECPMWETVARPGSPGRGSSYQRPPGPNECMACKALGKPWVHAFRDCPVWMHSQVEMLSKRLAATGQASHSMPAGGAKGAPPQRQLPPGGKGYNSPRGRGPTPGSDAQQGAK